MPTQNTVVTRTGTGFTVDVTVLDLLPDLAIKDFVVLVNSALNPNTNWTKSSKITLTYTGVSLPVNSTIELRRLTPTNSVTTAQFGSRIRSADWNAELDRIVRRAEEYALNGVGAGSIVSVLTPINEAFGVNWSTDILFPPTRQAVYNAVVNLAPLLSPVFTGAPKAPTPLTSDNSTNLATTAFVSNSLASYALLSSPTFSGTPSLPTGATGITQSVGTNDNRLATNAFVSTSNRPAVEAIRASSTQSIPHNTATTLIYNSETLDTSSTYNILTGEYTVAVAGRYLVQAGTFIDAGCTVLSLGLFVNGVEQFRLDDSRSSTDLLFLAAGSFTVNCALNDVITIRLTQSNTGSLARNFTNALNFSRLSIIRVNV